jgi:CRISPR-associated protein Cas2
MLVLVSYDVSTVTPEGRRRLRKIARECCNFGQRVQYSVFECLVDPGQWKELRQRLLSLYNPAEDSLRFYQLGSNWKGGLEHHGARETPALDEALLL